jgi:hypothetical protein
VKKDLVILRFDVLQRHVECLKNLNLDMYFASQNRNESIFTERADYSVGNG